MRNVWSSDVVVECIVDPADVVSVPKDYNATKMRVCRYKVMGYSDKSRKGEEIVSLNDFLDTPLPEYDTAMSKKANNDAEKPNELGEQITKEASTKKAEFEVTENPYINELNGMVAREIVDYVEKHTGEKITFSLKSKKSIYNKAVKLLTEYFEKQELKKDLNYQEVVKEKVEKNSELDIYDLSKEKLLDLASDKFNERLDESDSRDTILSQVEALCKNAGISTKTKVLGVRTQSEIDRQIEGLEKMRENLPEFNYFGDNNWEGIDTQLSIIRGESILEDYENMDEDADEEDNIYQAAFEADGWLYGQVNEDLFED
ncbi:MAG: hypothetical protein KC414_10365 [Romboutsia sp.]|nr:hypothetical protein [Romboutsia sp.]